MTLTGLQPLGSVLVAEALIKRKGRPAICVLAGVVSVGGCWGGVKPSGIGCAVKPSGSPLGGFAVACLVVVCLASDGWLSLGVASMAGTLIPAWVRIFLT